MLTFLCVLCVLLVVLVALMAKAVSGLYTQLLESERGRLEARMTAATCLAAEAELKRQAEHWRKAAERTKRLYLAAYSELGALKEKQHVD